MLTRLIVDLYSWIVEIVLWLMLLIAAVAGYHSALPLLSSFGLIPQFAVPWQILGALLFAAAAFPLLAIFVGPILVLIDIRNLMRFMCAEYGDANTVPPRHMERREPSL